MSLIVEGAAETDATADVVPERLFGMLAETAAPRVRLERWFELLISESMLASWSIN